VRCEDRCANECHRRRCCGADGIVLGSPVYFMDVTPEMKALIDRTGFVSLANGRMYKDKVGATVRRSSPQRGMHAIDSMNHFLLRSAVLHRWPINRHGSGKGDVEKDEEGIQLTKSLGQRMLGFLGSFTDKRQLPSRQGKRGLDILIVAALLELFSHIVNKDWLDPRPLPPADRFVIQAELAMAWLILGEYD